MYRSNPLGAWVLQLKSVDFLHVENMSVARLQICQFLILGFEVFRNGFLWYDQKHIPRVHLSTKATAVNA